MIFYALIHKISDVRRNVGRTTLRPALRFGDPIFRDRIIPLVQFFHPGAPADEVDVLRHQASEPFPSSDESLMCQFGRRNVIIIFVKRYKASLS